MVFQTVIGTELAASHVDDPGWVFVDCRFVLGDPDAGRRAFADGHVPGAVYADLETELSGPVIPGRTGRHPLPDRSSFAETISRLGIGPDTQVVAYDASTGAMAAARLWWLLRWAGHDGVAVLDGGFSRWTACGNPVEAGDPAAPHPAQASDPAQRGEPAATIPAQAGDPTATIPAQAGEPAASNPAQAGEPAAASRTPAGQAGATRIQRDPVSFRPDLVAGAAETADSAIVVDVRAADRYRGENEVIDPVAGHIPGAINLPFTGNVTSDGTFRTPAELREVFAPIAARGEPVFYCGSGVTAAHSVLAYHHAGLGMPRLYAGSWSEWITDPARPVEVSSPAD
jgi:thiosulfate/3-mercaptopyruvate sulfurtransferase